MGLPLLGAGPSKAVPAMANPLTVSLSRDTYISGENVEDPGAEDTNYGSSTSLLGADSEDPINVKRILIYADLSALAGKTIGNTSRLRLQGPTGVESVFSAHDFQMKRVTRNWPELEVTWNVFAEESNWTAPGGDFTTPTVSWTGDGLATSYDITGAGFAAFVQDAIDNRSGIVNAIIKVVTENGSNAGIIAASRNNATAGLRPEFSIAWS